MLLMLRYYTKGSVLWTRFSWATVFSWAGAQGYFRDMLFPDARFNCSTGSLQQRFVAKISLISEPSGLVQADFTDDRVIVVLCSAVEAGALPQYFLL